MAMDDREFRLAETQWLAYKASVRAHHLSRTVRRGKPDDLMVVWAEALRKSQERELREAEQKKVGDGGQ